MLIFLYLENAVWHQYVFLALTAWSSLVYVGKSCIDFKQWLLGNVKSKLYDVFYLVKISIRCFHRYDLREIQLYTIKKLFSEVLTPWIHWSIRAVTTLTMVDTGSPSGLKRKAKHWRPSQCQLKIFTPNKNMHIFNMQLISPNIFPFYLFSLQFYT